MQWVTLQAMNWTAPPPPGSSSAFSTRRQSFSSWRKMICPPQSKRAPDRSTTLSLPALPVSTAPSSSCAYDNGLDRERPRPRPNGAGGTSREKAGWAKDGSENHGLWAIANGMTTLTEGNDAEMIERMMPVYDALYAYCQQRARGEAGWKSDRAAPPLIPRSGPTCRLVGRGRCCAVFTRPREVLYLDMRALRAVCRALAALRMAVVPSRSACTNCSLLSMPIA